MTVKRRGGAVKGAGRVRKLLRRLPEDIAAEMVRELEREGPRALGEARSGAPVKTGRLRNALDYRVYPKTLRLRVGLLRKNKSLFYGHILEVGRKAQTVMRRGPSGAMHKVDVKAISPGTYDMVGGRVKRDVRRRLRAALSEIYERALKKASGAAGNE